MPKIIPYARHSAAALGYRVGTLRPRAVAALLEVLVLRRLLRIDLPLDRVGAVFLLFVPARLTGIGRRARRVHLRLLRGRIRARARAVVVGAFVASRGQRERGGENGDLQAHRVLLGFD